MSRTLTEWLAHIEQVHPKSIDMGLDRVRVVAARMALARPAPVVITVGGTNGKGSTVAFIESIARQSGRRVGVYTSPHLLAFNERIRIDGVDAGDAAIVDAFEAIDVARLHGDPVALTYFEYATLAALWLFARAALDLVVLEVGLGGRLDATNLVDPDVAVITTVDLDHQDYLGVDREAIGFEKAGIARAWQPLVLGDDDPPSSVLRHAYAIGAACIRANCDFFFSLREIDADTDSDSDVDPIAPLQPAVSAWTWRDVGHAMTLPLPALLAPVQLRNAAVAIAALRATSLDIDDAAIARGVANARLRGRLQRVDRDGISVLLDVAHNPQAARALAAWLEASPIEGHTRAVFAALGDKDVRGVVEALAPHIDHWHLAGLAGPRAIDAETLAARLGGTPAASATRHADVDAALAHALAASRPGDRVLVFGSFHTVADAMRVLEAP